jgi:hypothetical protein
MHGNYAGFARSVVAIVDFFARQARAGSRDGGDNGDRLQTAQKAERRLANVRIGSPSDVRYARDTREKRELLLETQKREEVEKLRSKAGGVLENSKFHQATGSASFAANFNKDSVP